MGKSKPLGEIKDIKIDNTSKIKPKTKPQFDIQLNEEQKEAKKIILENDIIVLFGKPGSGKTILSVQIALDSFFSKDIDKIYITRPTVSKEDIGFLPGSLEEKMDPWLAPIYDNFDKCYGSTAGKKQTIKNMIEKNEIIISPLSFMRGITVSNSIMLVDECQNITIEQAMMIVGRIGIGSKIIFCGDYRQIDLKNKNDSGLEFLLECGEGIDGFTSIELQSNHRHPILDKFMVKFDEYQNKNKK